MLRGSRPGAPVVEAQKTWAIKLDQNQFTIYNQYSHSFISFTNNQLGLRDIPFSWRLIEMGPNAYGIIHAQSGVALALTPDTNGFPVTVQRFNGAPQQRWVLQRTA